MTGHIFGREREPKASGSGRKSKRGIVNMEYDLTARQKEILEKFTERVADISKSDWDSHYLTKWLYARNFDIVKAEEMLRASVKYREKMRIDHILEEYEVPEVLGKYLIGGMCGRDKEGLPIRIEPFGNLDMKGIMKSVKKTDLEKIAIRNCEQLLRECQYQSKVQDKRIDGYTLIFDMANFSRKMLWRPGLSVYIANAEILQNNYPEMQKRMFIINAPKVFPILWKLAQPIISENTKRKMKVLGKNYKEELLKYIDEDQLPVFLGGTMTGPNGDPLCSHKICHGGEVPESYYLDDSVASKTADRATISPGNDLKIECEIESPGSILSWNFKTEHKDIGFGITVKPEGSTKEKELIPVSRVDSQVLEQDGNIICEQAGKYYLIFDNSYSWAVAKTLYYEIDVYTDDDSSPAVEVTSS